IRRKGNGIPAGIGAGQRAILGALPADGDTLTVDKSNGATVQSVGRAFRNAMESEHRNKFYHANRLYLVAGVFVSVLVLMSTLVLGNLEPETIAAAIGMIFPCVVVAVIAGNV